MLRERPTPLRKHGFRLQIGSQIQIPILRDKAEALAKERKESVLLNWRLGWRYLSSYTASGYSSTVYSSVRNRKFLRLRRARRASSIVSPRCLEDALAVAAWTFKTQFRCCLQGAPRRCRWR